MNRHFTPILSLLSLLFLSLSARAETGIDEVRVGWGNTYRAGRWNPIYVTSESTPPREVVAQIEGMTGAPHAMGVQSRFALSPSPSTHVVHFPLGEGYELAETTLILRDAETKKRIAGTRLALTPPVQQAPLGQPMIGVSGDESTWQLLRDQFAGDATVGYLTPPYLPDAVVGYDALDVLILNSPDLSKIREDQQRATVDWIRGGGTLVLWPGAAATPDNAPLLEWMPALIGENALVELDPAAVEAAGLTRVTRIRSRRLSPLPDGEAVPLIGQQVTAFRRAVGLGQILLSPVELSTLRFRSEDAVRKFWAPVLQGVPDHSRDKQPTATVTRWLRDAHAARVRLVPLGVIAVLVVVGPVDSLLLRLLGRRPWTVVTVIGWVGLIAAVTMNVREGSRERSVAYRTVRVIDEVDGAAAAKADFVAVRWPEGSTFAFPDERGAWWQPAADPTDPPGSARSEFHAQQHAGGNWPLRMAAHVPTPRVLHVQRWAAEQSLMVADLSLRDGRLAGKLTNRGERPLTNVRIRVAGGVARLEGPRVEPGATIDVSAAIDANDQSLDMPPPETFYYARRATDAPILLPDYREIEGSTFLRASRIASLVASGTRACVYAEVEDPPPPAELSVPVHQKHMTFVRSVVRLN